MFSNCLGTACQKWSWGAKAAALFLSTAGKALGQWHSLQLQFWEAHSHDNRMDPWPFIGFPKRFITKMRLKHHLSRNVLVKLTTSVNNFMHISEWATAGWDRAQENVLCFCHVVFEMLMRELIRYPPSKPEAQRAQFELQLCERDCLWRTCGLNGNSENESVSLRKR